jgi:predicted Rossmann-fold nucleotide-binding protein
LSEGKIAEEDMHLFTLVDTAEEAVKVIEDFYRKYSLKPNF